MTLGRSFPSVVGASARLMTWREGTTVTTDGDTGFAAFHSLWLEAFLQPSLYSPTRTTPLLSGLSHTWILTARQTEGRRPVQRRSEAHLSFTLPGTPRPTEASRTVSPFSSLRCPPTPLAKTTRRSLPRPTQRWSSSSLGRRRRGKDAHLGPLSRSPSSTASSHISLARQPNRGSRSRRPSGTRYLLNSVPSEAPGPPSAQGTPASWSDISQPTRC